MARSSVTGDFRKLQDIAKRLGNLTGQNALTAINNANAEATLKLIDRGFEQEREPSGRPWHEKVFPDGRPVLGRTGALRRSFRKRQVTSRDFEVESTDAKFKFHQSGTGVRGPRKRRIRPVKKSVLAWRVRGNQFFAHSVEGTPQRKMLPEKGKMPTTWRVALEKETIKTLRKRLGG